MTILSVKNISFFIFISHSFWKTWFFLLCGRNDTGSRGFCNGDDFPLLSCA